jgi:hypothetical protein
MRNFLNVTIVALALAATTGCQCCDSLVQFEQCKNECLFGWLRGSGCNLFGSSTCEPACAPTAYPTTTLAPTACDPCSTQYGPQMIAPYAGDCYGGTAVMSAPACQSGCGTSIPGQTVILPGQTVITPNSTLAPTPVPTLLP